MSKKTAKYNRGHFPAKYLPMLRPFVELARNDGDDRFVAGNIFLEPTAAGGIHIVAVTGVAMAVIHVPDGMVRRPCALDIPDDAFEIAASGEPIAMTFEGAALLYDLPEWAQPGTCYVSDAGMFINPKMRPPQLAEQHSTFFPALFQRIASTGLGCHFVGHDYRMEEKAAPDWRKALHDALQQPTYTDPCPMGISPALIALFEKLHSDMSHRDEKLGHFWFRLSGTAEAPSPAVVTIENHPEFVGLIMRQKTAEPHPVPSHFFFPANTSAEVKQ